jgi:hypothetical protein
VRKGATYAAPVKASPLVSLCMLTGHVRRYIRVLHAGNILKAVRTHGEPIPLWSGRDETIIDESAVEKYREEGPWW